MKIPKEINYFQVAGKNILKVGLKNREPIILKGKITQKKLNEFKIPKLKTLL